MWKGADVARVSDLFDVGDYGIGNYDTGGFDYGSSWR
jgi:hypothetical protein